MTAVSLLLLVGALLWAPAGRAAAPDVRYVNTRVTADLRDVELADVLPEIASQAGFEIRGKPTPQPLTLRLDAVPLAEAMSRLLEGQSVALTYDRSGGLKEVRFLDSSTEALRPSPAGAGPAIPPDAGGPGSIAASDRPVPISGLLADALGSDRSTFLQIVGVALQVGDARLRMEALREGLRLLAAEPDLRAEVSRTLDGHDNAALAAWLEQIAGANADEIARRTARLARWKPLRRRAAAVGRLIRADHPPRTDG